MWIWLFPVLLFTDFSSITFKLRLTFSYVLGQHAVVTSSDLPMKLEALSTSDETNEVNMCDQPGTSKSWKSGIMSPEEKLWVL